MSKYESITAFPSKPHIAVLTDICNEPDDAESLTRFLLYSNEFHVDALIATTSTWQRTATHAEQIHQILDAYASVQGNLNAHVPPTRKYPTVDSLRAVVRSGLPGYGMAAARGQLNEGTQLLIKAVDAVDTQFWVLLWGGANVLAQALMQVQETRSKAELLRFTSKLRVYSISDQDDTGAWIRLTFPNIFYIASVHAWNQYGLAAWTGISGEEYYHFNPGGPDTSLVGKEWLEKHIQVGSYGKVAYPSPAFIIEGDTPTFLSLIQNGLTDPDHPEWGGWGGRYGLTDASGINKHYSDTADTVLGLDGKMHLSSQATIWRWREAYQSDFAARMQWTLSSNFSQANHAPVAVVNNDSSNSILHIQVAAGATVELDASGSWDPDNGELEFRWMHYREPSATQWAVKFEVPILTFEDVSLSSRKLEKVQVKMPGSDEGVAHPLEPGTVFKYGPKIYHLILEVVDKAKYQMRSYRRILVEVVAAEEKP